MNAVLLQWHVEDPVDDLERARNNVVFLHQGNRNPFIDHPEWVEGVFPSPPVGIPLQWVSALLILLAVVPLGLLRWRKSFELGAGDDDLQ